MEPVTSEQIRRRIEEALPGAEARVAAFHGSDHFEAMVVAPQFRGLSRIDQHRLVYAALEGWIGGPVHALALKTAPPEAGS